MKFRYIYLQNRISTNEVNNPISLGIVPLKALSSKGFQDNNKKEYLLRESHNNIIIARKIGIARRLLQYILYIIKEIEVPIHLLTKPNIYQ